MMELPQPQHRSLEGRKSTHDFLSLCSQQDPITRPSQGSFLKTHDFLGKNSTKEEVSCEISSVEKPPPAAPPPSMEHLLPGGIGTYSISHITYFNHKVPKPEATVFTVAQTSSTTDRNDENSNCSSYTNSGFALWEENAAKKGKTGKENSQTAMGKEPVVQSGQWPSSSDRPVQSNSNKPHHHHHSNSFSTLSSLQTLGQKNPSFMDMIKSAKAASSQEDELDDDEEFIIKKELSPAPRDLRVKVNGKSSEQKPNTPRSKHSATEQRRRSKINDRFQMLRTLLPQNDQKRDKASFLLEVIEYIQFLQEKVQKYEGSFPGWNYEPAKMMPWRNDELPAETYVDHLRAASNGGATVVFGTKNDESLPITGGSKNHPVSDAGATSGPIFNTGNHLNISSPSKGVPFPVSLQPTILGPATGTQLSPVVGADTEAKTLQPQSNWLQTKPWVNECTALNDKLKEQDLGIEGGTISVSSAYSRGLFNTITQALHSSGVDLSQASISVQIELGKRERSSIQKENEASSNYQGIARARASEDDTDQASKKLKTGKS